MDPDNRQGQGSREQGGLRRPRGMELAEHPPMPASESRLRPWGRPYLARKDWRVRRRGPGSEEWKRM